MTIPLWRRLALAAIATSAAGFAFHGSLASALVSRGDDAIRAGDPDRGVAMYERARRLAPELPIASDRLAFHLLQRREPGDALRALAILNAAIERRGDDAQLLLDRALAGTRLSRWDAAERDFARAADITHDARYEHFAGRAALHAGRRAAALRHFRTARTYDPRFLPAVRALRELQG